MDETTPPAPPLAVRVVGGGQPTDEQLAALLVALTPAPAAAPPSPAATATGTRTTMAAWSRAALIEGVGGAAAARPADLDTAWR